MKKSFKIVSIISIVVLLSVLVIYIAISSSIKKSLITYWSEDELNYTYHEYEVVRCNYNILYPEVAMVLEQQFKDYDNEYIVHFYDIVNPFKKDKSNRLHTGSTTVKNTTFDELVSMVEEDCSQFQKSKGDSQDKTINWSYAEAETQAEIDAEKINTILSGFDDYSDVTKEIFIEKYGDVNLMSHKEVLDIYNKIVEEGLDGDVLRQIELEDEEYQRKVESGEIHIETNEEFFRRSGFSEDEIKSLLQQKGEEYIGPK